MVVVLVSEPINTTTRQTFAQIVAPLERASGSRRCARARAWGRERYEARSVTIPASAAGLGTALEAFVRELVADEVARQFQARAFADGAVASSPWLSLDEAARYLRISTRTLERE